MDSAKIRMAGSLLWKPIVGVIAGIILLGLLSLIYFRFQRPVVRNQQMAAVVRQAGHGKVELRNSMYVDGIPAAQVRYPNRSLHTVFFLAHKGKIRGIVVGGHVYTDQGTPWAVAWPKMPKSEIIQIPQPTTSAAQAQKTELPVASPPMQGKGPQDPLTAKAVLRYVSFTHGFVWGHDEHTPIDALVDPNCIYCHRWFVSEKAAVDAGKISFRIIPVAALKPSSVLRAIEIMSAKNPLQLWLQSENGFRVKTESGGIPTTLLKNKAMQKTVAVNTAILYAVDNHHPFTPTFVDTRTGQVWMGANHNQELDHVFVR
ncbi:MAG: hypothetical protein M1492_03560 [Gammaproteobacteria bacterium]|nr:hypothetical protein [Gammaproteobacteria bacterium]